MNKLSIIRIFSLLAVMFVYLFVYIEKDLNQFLISLIFLIIPISIYMYKNKNKVNKFKFIYDVTLLLLIIFSLALLCIIAYWFLNAILYTNTINFIINFLKIIFIIILIFLLIENFKRKLSKEKEIIFILVNLVFIIFSILHLYNLNILDGNYNIYQGYFDKNIILIIIMYILIYLSNKEV